MSLRNYRKQAYLFYQSIGMIPLDAKPREWVLHHLDPNLKYKDKTRYNRCYIYDVIPIPVGVHSFIHNKDKILSNDSKEKISKSLSGRKQSIETIERRRQSNIGVSRNKGKTPWNKDGGYSHWKLVDGKRVWYNE